MSIVEDAIIVVGKCGLAFVQALLTNPELKASVKGMLIFQLAAVEQAILVQGERLEQLDAGSRFLDRVLAFARQEASAIERDFTVTQNFLATFISGCPATDFVAQGLEKLTGPYIQKQTADLVATITGKNEVLGDLNNAAYEAQRKITLRNEANKVINTLEQGKDYLQALIVLIDNL